MSLGYTIKVADAIRAADGSLIGVKLGQLCVKHGISVIEASRILGVTRQTVYLWFIGESYPKEQHMDAITSLIGKLSSTTDA